MYSTGEKSYQFALGSGVAEGCPQSPLLFLFIGEPLTRMLENDERLKGVTIGEHEHTVGQFADDTAAMLEGYQHLKKLFEIINKWERAAHWNGMQQIKNSTNTNGEYPERGDT